MNTHSKIRITLFAIALLVFTLPSNAQDAIIVDGDTDITIENNWLSVTFTKVFNFVAPGSITSVYDVRNDSDKFSNFVNARWLDLSAGIVRGNDTPAIIPQNMALVNQGSDWFVLRADKWTEKESGKSVRLKMDMTVRLVRNRIYVTYDFLTREHITFSDSLMAASFFSPISYDDANSFNWNRVKHLTPIETLDGSTNLVFDEIIQPTNQVRFAGSAGAVDIHSPDTAMDYAVISKTDDSWILFNLFIPAGNSCSYEVIENTVKKGTSFSKTVAILVNNPEDAGLFQDSGLPTATLSPIPYGGTNLMVNMVDDLPTLTFDNGDYYLVGGPGTTTGGVIDQLFDFLAEFPQIKVDLNLIFDSMITVSQETADRRDEGTNTEIYTDGNSGLLQIWNFHNVAKNVASAGTAAYHQWLQAIQNGEDEDLQNIGLVNRSYHVVRLEDVSLAEWETDPDGQAQKINANYIWKVLRQLRSDAKEIGIDVPEVYVPPALIFDDTLIDPVIKLGTAGMVFCKKVYHAHKTFTKNGELLAFYYNWSPTEKKARGSLIKMMRRGWPVISLGEYFNGRNNRYKRIVRIFNRVTKLFPETSYLLASEYVRLARERHDISWRSEMFDVPSGLLSIYFTGGSEGGQTILVNAGTGFNSLAGPPLIDGVEVENWRVVEGKIFVVLPELSAGEHVLLVELY